MRTRLPCSTSPRGAPAAAADMVGGAVVCLPTAGHEREREGAELLLGGAGRGYSRDPTFPPPNTNSWGAHHPGLRPGVAGAVPSPSPCRPPTSHRSGGGHTGTGHYLLLCAWDGGAGSCPHLGYHMPRPHRWGKNGGGLRKGGEKERKTAIERGGHRPGGGYGGGAAAPGPPGQWEPPLT